jgi:Spy/CpxP family protein refolding chaperone
MSFGVQGIGDPSQLDGSSTTTSLRGFANLDLTEDQRTQLRAIFKTAKTEGLSQDQVQSQIDNVLTPAQQQTLQTDVQNARSAHSGHHHHHGGGGSATSVNGVTEADIQNQIAAATALTQQQLQSEVSG